MCNWSILKGCFEQRVFFPHSPHKTTWLSQICYVCWKNTRHSTMTVPNVASIPSTQNKNKVLFNAHVIIPLLNAHYHVIHLINTEYICCTGDSYFVNLIHTAVSTLFNLPCSHTPLRFHSWDFNSRLFTGCGWLHNARNKKQHCSYPHTVATPSLERTVAVGHVSAETA